MKKQLSKLLRTVLISFQKRINFYFVINTHVFELVSVYEGSYFNSMWEWEFSFFIKCFHRWDYELLHSLSLSISSFIILLFFSLFFWELAILRSLFSPFKKNHNENLSLLSYSVSFLRSLSGTGTRPTPRILLQSVQGLCRDFSRGVGAALNILLCLF